MRDVRDALMVARNTDGKLVRRPLSPHIQIHRWPVSMALSILHRASGVALGIGTLLLTWFLVAAATSDDAFARVQWFLGSPIGILCLLGWAAALVFHTLSGLRHLYMDTGRGFEPDEYNMTGWAVVIGTGVLTLLLWIAGWMVR